MVQPKQTAFMEAYRPCHDSFLRYCTALAYNRMDVEDLVQDVLLSAYEHFEKIEKKGQLLHYLIRAARNRSISLWRKSKYKMDVLEQHSDRLVARGVSPELLPDIHFLYKALQQLPDKQRDAVILFEITGFSIKEIAALQDSTVGAIKTKISRGRQRLRALLREEKKERQSSVLASIPIVQSYDDDAFSLSDLSYDNVLEPLRQLPLELTQQEVFTLVQHFPTPPHLPPSDANWLSQLNWNSMIFSSASITAIVSSIALFVIIENTPHPVVTDTLATNSVAEEVMTTDISASKDDKNKQIVEPPTQASNAIKSLATKLNSLEATTGDLNDFDPILPPEVSDVAPKMVTLPPLERNHLSDFLFPTKKRDLDNYLPKIIENKQKPKVDNREVEAFGECEERVNFQGDILVFWKNITLSLKADDLFDTRKKKNRLIFFGNTLAMNQRLIPRHLQEKYQQMMVEYNIAPCSNRMVEITRQYIAIGDITNDGFKGTISGRVDIDDLHNTKIKELRVLDTKGRRSEK